MKSFEYASPTGVEQAVRALAGADSSEGLAGGTDLINRMKDYISSPERVVYLKEIEEDGFRGVGTEGDALVIGAGTTLADLLKDESIRSKCPALTQAARSIGTPQIRNMATLGGNLLQRPRCWYYRSGFGLLGGERGDSERLVRELEGEFAPYNIDEVNQPADGHLVRLGDNRYHAIFMTDGDALFVSPSSMAPILIALGAEATLVGPDGERTAPIADLYRVPSREDQRELTTTLGEVLTKVTIPNATARKSAHYEIRQKLSHDWPLVFAAVALKMDGETVGDADVILGAVAPVPYRSEAAQKAIAGKRITEETAAAAGEAATEGAQPLSKNGYKVPLVKTAVKRALLRAVGNAYWEEMEA